MAAMGERQLLESLITKLTQHASSDGLRQEFYALPDDGNDQSDHTAFSTNWGNKTENKRKNRYKDIVPYDYTRVTLLNSFGPDSDYVNANFVKGPTGKPSYIACQGPLKNTVIDMWRMIWECGVNAVIMACNEKEGERIKCERYWPASTDEPLKIDDVFLVRLISEKSNPNDDYVVRRMRVTLLQSYIETSQLVDLTADDQVTRKNESGQLERDVTQYHYIGWPDYGIPSSNGHLIQLLTELRAEYPSTDVPIVVHCSAGCGRTGTVMCIDYVSSLIRLNMLTAEVSVKNIILEMRRQRAAVVQSFDQYVMCYRCVIELLNRRLTELNGGEVLPVASLINSSFNSNSKHVVAKPSISDKLQQHRGEAGDLKLKIGRVESGTVPTPTPTANEPNSARLFDASPNSPFVQVPSASVKSKSANLSPASPAPNPAPASAFVYSPSSTKSISSSNGSNANSPAPFERGGAHSSLKFTSELTPLSASSAGKAKQFSKGNRNPEDRNNNQQSAVPSAFGSDLTLSRTPAPLTRTVTDSSAPSTPSRQAANKVQLLFGFGKKVSTGSESSPSPSLTSPNGGSNSNGNGNGNGESNKMDESRATRMCQFVFRGIDTSFRKLVGAHPQGARDPPWTPPQS